MALRVVVTLLLIAGVACGDALTLRDGRVVQGTYLGGDARQVRMRVGEKIEAFDLSAVAKIEFVAPLTGAAEPAPASPTAPAAAVNAEAKPAGPALAAPQPAANAAGTLNGLAALIAIVAASPNVEKAPEIPANPFTSLPGGASKTPEPKPRQPNQP
ncbi:MAG: hypothetical protein NT090_13625 [Acidobacteria bacterium]|nr:hypothetical protein [Acidobacteriota bacterium]